MCQNGSWLLDVFRFVRGGVGHANPLAKRERPMKWRALFEASPMARDAEDSGGILFGNPASESDIHALEQRLGVVFPAEFKEIYREFNGVGSRYGDEDIWWLVPLDQIEAQTQMLRQWWFEDADSEALAGRMVCFGDWFNGDQFGYIANEGDKTLNPVIYEYNHEVGRVESWERGLEEFLQST